MMKVKWVGPHLDTEEREIDDCLFTRSNDWTCEMNNTAAHALLNGPHGDEFEAHEIKDKDKEKPTPKPVETTTQTIANDQTPPKKETHPNA